MKKKLRNKGPGLKAREIRIEELEQILERVRGVLSPEDHDKLQGAVQTLGFLTRELEAKGASIQRLRSLLFGPSTEKTAQVLGRVGAGSLNAKSHQDWTTGASTSQVGSQSQEGGSGTAATEQVALQEARGHGRNGAAAYAGAKKVKVFHARLRHKDRCPDCERGKLYLQPEPSPLVRVTGMAPLSATLYELERLRCNLCGQVYTAAAPEGVGTAKYDESAVAMVGLLKYGCGFPFHRLDWLQSNLGIPLPATTQWDLVSEAAVLLEPAHAQLIEQAAQGQVLHNDDTTMKILRLEPPKLDQQHGVSDSKAGRTGTFTTGIVSISGGHQIALFFTGRQHAGENLQDVLAHRAAEQSVAIQMCDALSRNTKGDFQTIVANCLAHGRRRFVDVAHSFPDECRHVLEALGQVYAFDAQARAKNLPPQERLLFHQQHSGPVLEELHRWLQEQFEQRKVEPNSVLGKAIGYLLNHWPKLTLFLRQAGAPLDNNLCEQALKKAILHRKNSLFYKTENGARVGDLYMSLIHSAELCNVDPFAYLLALQRHHLALLDDPAAWMPWNYIQTLHLLAQPTAEPRASP
jgi:transposase